MKAFVQLELEYFQLAGCFGVPTAQDFALIFEKVAHRIAYCNQHPISVLISLRKTAVWDLSVKGICAQY